MYGIICTESAAKYGRLSDSSTRANKKTCFNKALSKFTIYLHMVAKPNLITMFSKLGFTHHKMRMIIPIPQRMLKQK